MPQTGKHARSPLAAACAAAAWALALVAAGGPALAAAAAPSGTVGDASRIAVFVSIPPQAMLVERVGGTRVRVDVLVPPGQSPHTFEPTPKQLARLAGARVFFAIGLPFEKRLLEKAAAANASLKVVDMRAGVPLRRMAADEGAADHDDAHADGAAETPGHDAEHAHEAGEPDPHVWLSPRNAKVLAANACRALADLDPAHRDAYAANLKALEADLDAVDARIARALAPLKGKDLLVFHPAFGYFADAYGLRQVAVEIEGKEPGARALATLIDRARASGAKVIFVQPQFSPKSAEAVARAIGGAVVPMDPLAQDYLANLEAMAAKVRRALAPE